MIHRPLLWRIVRRTSVIALASILVSLLQGRPRPVRAGDGLVTVDGVLGIAQSILFFGTYFVAAWTVVDADDARLRYGRAVLHVWLGTALAGLGGPVIDMLIATLRGHGDGGYWLALPIVALLTLPMSALAVAALRTAGRVRGPSRGNAIDSQAE